MSDLIASTEMDIDSRNIEAIRPAILRTNGLWEQTWDIFAT